MADAVITGNICRGNQEGGVTVGGGQTENRRVVEEGDPNLNPNPSPYLNPYFRRILLECNWCEKNKWSGIILQGKSSSVVACNSCVDNGQSGKG